jgi:monovalent cation:H+ antiporter, CPA1 family
MIEMQPEAIFMLLFIVATAVAIGVRRVAVPYTVALVLAGLGLRLIGAFEAPHLTKALLFNIFLPGLIFNWLFWREYRYVDHRA